jgi:hypothetical protein
MKECIKTLVPYKVEAVRLDTSETFWVVLYLCLYCALWAIGGVRTKPAHIGEGMSIIPPVISPGIVKRFRLLLISSYYYYYYYNFHFTRNSSRTSAMSQILLSGMSLACCRVRWQSFNSHNKISSKSRHLFPLYLSTYYLTSLQNTAT